MKAGEFLVNKNRRRAGGESQHDLKAVGFAVADEMGDFLRDARGGELGLLKDDDGDVFPLGGFE